MNPFSTSYPDNNKIGGSFSPKLVIFKRKISSFCRSKEAFLEIT